MQMDPIEVTDKLGRKVVLRSADVTDASDLMVYMNIVSGETPFLVRTPGEFKLSIQQEQNFILSRLTDPGALLMMASIDGRHVGNCSFYALSPYKRYGHRCIVSIALYQKYWNAGIGEEMLKKALEIAKQTGYTQAELEVLTSNTPAIAMYEKLGFKKYGSFPDSVCFEDGHFEDSDWMMKKL